MNELPFEGYRPSHQGRRVVQGRQRSDRNHGKSVSGRVETRRGERYEKDQLEETSGRLCASGGPSGGPHIRAAGDDADGAAHPGQDHRPRPPGAAASPGGGRRIDAARPWLIASLGGCVVSAAPEGEAVADRCTVAETANQICPTGRRREEAGSPGLPSDREPERGGESVSRSSGVSKGAGFLFLSPPPGQW